MTHGKLQRLDLFVFHLISNKSFALTKDQFQPKQNKKINFTFFTYKKKGFIGLCLM